MRGPTGISPQIVFDEIDTATKRAALASTKPKPDEEAAARSVTPLHILAKLHPKPRNDDNER